MQNRSQGDQVADAAEEGGSRVRMVECPNCKSSVPLSIYCLKCGYPMYNLMAELQKGEEAEGEPPSGEVVFRLEPEDLKEETTENPDSEDSQETELVEDETVDGDNDAPNEAQPTEPANEEPEALNEEAPESMQVGAQEPEAPAFKPERPFEPDERIIGLMRNLANSVNLKLWSVGELLDGRMSEDNFRRLHGGYNERWRQFMDQRSERLTHAGDLESLEQGLERARVNLGELEVRRTIGDLYNGEYEAKAPAFQWEISHFEGEMDAKRGEIEFLGKLSNVIPKEEVVQMAEKARAYLERMRSSEGLMEMIKGTNGNLRASIEEILELLEEE